MLFLALIALAGPALAFTHDALDSRRLASRNLRKDVDAFKSSHVVPQVIKTFEPYAT